MRLHVGIGVVGCIVASVMSGGCEYFATRTHGASYFASRPYEYPGTFHPQGRQFVPPMARGGGPPTAANPEGLAPVPPPPVR
jgi:hypothetical protein